MEQLIKAYNWELGASNFSNNDNSLKVIYVTAVYHRSLL